MLKCLSRALKCLVTTLPLFVAYPLISTVTNPRLLYLSIYPKKKDRENL